MGTIAKLISIILSCSLFGCYAVSSYRGDGELSDQGALRSFERYKVVLGNVHLAGGSRTATFHAGNLPHRKFVLGLEMDGCDAPPKDIRIELSIRTQSGERVIEEGMPMTNLNWYRSGTDCANSIAFGYVPSRSKQIPISNDGGVYNAPVYSGVDCGNGSYFIPHLRTTYEIVLTIRGDSGDRSDIARVVLRDNGSPISESHCPYPSP